MGVVAVAADKGSPGVTTAALAIAAVWPRPVLLAECDAAGGDLLYRLPAADGGRLDPQRGLLSLAVAARRGIQPHQVWRHTQKLHGGLDILTGLVNAEQAAGLQLLWGEIGKVLSEVPEVDVIADCGRLGPDGPFYDLLAHASALILVARVTLEDVVRLRDRVIAVARGLANRRLSGVPIGVVVVADHKRFKRSLAEVGQALAQSGAPARILGGLADEPKSARMLRGQWGTRLDRSLLIRTARELAARLARELPVYPGPSLQASALSGAEGPTSPQPVHGESGRMPPEPVFGMPVIAGPVTPLPHATGSKTEPQGFTAPEPVMPLQLAAAPVPETAASMPASTHSHAPPEPAPPDPAARASVPLAPDPVPERVLQQVPGPAAGDGPPQRAAEGAGETRTGQVPDAEAGE